MEIDTIVHGDCLDVMQTFPDKSVDCVITSPPYPGVLMWGELFRPENWVKCHEWLNQIWDECHRVLKPGCKLIINIANTKRRPYLPNTHKIYKWALRAGIEPLGELIWNKGYGQCGTAWGSYCNPSDPSLADQHEYILIFRKTGEREKQPGYHIPARDFKSWRNSIWTIPPASATREGHKAPFPEEIPLRLIHLYTYEGEIVLDPFAGSGTTLAVAKRLKRHWIGIEHNAEYAELCRRNIAATQLPMF